MMENTDVKEYFVQIIPKEMDVLVRQIATKLSVKRGERYSDTVGFV